MKFISILIFLLGASSAIAQTDCMKNYVDCQNGDITTFCASDYDVCKSDQAQMNRTTPGEAMVYTKEGGMYPLSYVGKRMYNQKGELQIVPPPQPGDVIKGASDNWRNSMGNSTGTINNWESSGENSTGTLYKWKDENGVLHVSNNSGSIPDKYKNQMEHGDKKESESKQVGETSNRDWLRLHDKLLLSNPEYRSEIHSLHEERKAEAENCNISFHNCILSCQDSDCKKNCEQTQQSCFKTLNEKVELKIKETLDKFK